MAQREPGDTNERADRWAALARTARQVRACDRDDAREATTGRCRLPAVFAGSAFIVAAVAVAAMHVVASSVPASADGGLDSQLFSLTNQDRASNGVHSLNYSGALQSVGESGPYRCGGITVYGRSLDMIQRNYFSHVILGCGTYVWPMMLAYGVNYRSAGENIGWESGTSSASYINQAFMNSPDHRANILNSAYTHMGVGSAYGASWSGAGGSMSAWMFSEEFAQLGNAPPPPRPHPSGGGGVRGGSVPRNAPAPGAPGQPAAQIQPPSTPSSTPLPTPTPVPLSLLPVSAYPPPEYQSGGLLPDSIESVLEAFLIG